MRSMKEGGLREVRSALSRVRKLHAMGRVPDTDFTQIQYHLEYAEGIMLRMTELDKNGEEIIDG